MAKSPIYGRGRNRKHRAPRSPHHAAAANINMKGKKSKTDHCRCCICIDMREKFRDEEHRKEMRDRGEEFLPLTFLFTFNVIYYILIL